MARMASGSPTPFWTATSAPSRPALFAVGETTTGRRIWVYIDSTLRTVVAAFALPLLLAIAIIAALLLILALFGLAPSIDSLLKLASAGGVEGEKERFAPGAIAFGAIAVVLMHLTYYSLSGPGYLARRLGKSIPAADVLARTPKEELHFYHGVLKYSGAVGFVCEFAFQVLAFGAATWGLAVALPGAHLFLNPDTLSIQEAIRFWLDIVFGLVDGQHVFGARLSVLEANSAIWPFGVAIVSYKLFVIGMIVRLFQLSLNLRPGDISRDWGNALEQG